MPSSFFKLLIGTTSIGIIGGAGVATSYILSGESIKEYIEKTKSSKNKVFLTSSNPNLEDIKKKYKSYQGNKRPKPANINEDKLVDWCSNNANSKFSGKKDTNYLIILSWCFVNPKTISEEMKARNKEIISSKGASDEEWKRVWDNYKNNKKNLNLEIKDTTSKNLNGENRDNGASELHKWCTNKNQESKKLYEDDTEEIYELFNAWCTKDI